MQSTGRTELQWPKVSLPVIEGTEGEHAVDVSKLLDQTGCITLDPGFGNTGSCTSTHHLH